MQSLSSIEEEQERLEFFNSKERVDMIRLIVYSIGHKIKYKDTENFIKTLTTYEWHFTYDLNKITNRIYWIITIIDKYGFKWFPLTDRLYFMFRGVYSLMSKLAVIRICRPELLSFYIDVGFPVNYLYDIINRRRILKLGSTPSVNNIKFKEMMPMINVYLYLQRTMITI
jgi:hypothetical protein